MKQYDGNDGKMNKVKIHVDPSDKEFEDQVAENVVCLIFFNDF